MIITQSSLPNGLPRCALDRRSSNSAGREKGISPIFNFFFNRDKASLDIFWLKDKSLEQPISPIPTFSPRKSSKISKPSSKQFRETAAEKDQ